MWDRLEQPQQASVLHLRQSAEDNQSWDPETLFLFFQRLCHNPREGQEAVQRLTGVRQREDESLVAYLARFERLTYEASASSWPDVTRVSTLHRGLRPALRQSLEESEDSLFSLPYDAYVELMQRYDRRSRQHQPRQQPQTRTGHQQPRASAPPVPRLDPMDTDPIQLNTVRITSSSSRRSSSRSPRRSLSSLTAADRRADRLEHDLCLCCGSDKHWISACPVSRSRSSSSSRSRSSSRSSPPRTKTTAKREFLGSSTSSSPYASTRAS